jgi:hypothetical protein
MVEKIKRGIEKRKIIFTIAIAALIIICIGVLMKKPKVELPSLVPLNITPKEEKEGIPTPTKGKEEGIPSIEVTTFTIKVIDSSTGELLSGVKVTFDTLTAITDNGTVQFQNQRIDVPHRISLSKEGYYSKSWTWEPGYKTTITLDLLKIS